MNNELTNANLLEDGLDDNFSGFALRIGKFHIGKRSAKQMQKDDKLDEKKAERKEKRAEKKAEGKGFWQQLAKFNPVIALGRAGVLAGARLNFSGMSVRLYPAFITEAEAKQKKIKLTSIPKAKTAWDKVSKFYRNIGGNPNKLESEIKKGYNKPVFKTKKSNARTKSSFVTESYSGVAGGDDAVLIGSAMSLLTGIIGILNKSGADKNPREGGSDAEVNDAESQLPPESQSEVDKYVKLADEDKEKGLPLDDGQEDTIFGMPKWAFWTGTAVLGAGAILLLIKALKK